MKIVQQIPKYIFSPAIKKNIVFYDVFSVNLRKRGLVFHDPLGRKHLSTYNILSYNTKKKK